MLASQYQLYGLQPDMAKHFQVYGYTSGKATLSILVLPLFSKGDQLLKEFAPSKGVSTIQILCIGTDRSQQTVQIKIRLLLKKQSDQGLRCLPFHQHLLDALMQCYIKLYYF